MNLGWKSSDISEIEENFIRAVYSRSKDSPYITFDPNEAIAETYIRSQRVCLTYDGLIALMYGNNYGIDARRLRQYYGQTRNEFEKKVASNTSIYKDIDKCIYQVCFLCDRPENWKDNLLINIGYRPEVEERVVRFLKYLEYDAAKNGRRYKGDIIRDEYEVPFSPSYNSYSSDMGSLFIKRPFDYRIIKNGSYGSMVENRIKFESIDDERMQYLRTLANVKDESFKVLYEKPPVFPGAKHILLYKGVEDNEIIRKEYEGISYPFKQIIVGYDNTRMDTRGQASGYGLYTTTDFSIAAKYCEHVVYTYMCYYYKYTYTFIPILPEITSKEYDAITKYVTYDYDPENIEYPSERALELWLAIEEGNPYLPSHETYKATINDLIRRGIVVLGKTWIKENFDRIGVIKQRLIRECPPIRKLLEITKMIADGYYGYGDLDDDEKDNYYMKNKYDIIVSYTHGTSSSDYDYSDDDPLTLEEHILTLSPCYEVVPIHGKYLKVYEALLIEK